MITSADWRKVLAVGYNGTASGLPHNCDSNAIGACGCLHSEENAIINCDAPRDMRKRVFVTHSPCAMCAKRLINLGGVEHVYYLEPYRDVTPLQLLERVGIAVSRITVPLQ